jgi:hypothetical protein
MRDDLGQRKCSNVPTASVVKRLLALTHITGADVSILDWDFVFSSQIRIGSVPYVAPKHKNRKTLPRQTNRHSGAGATGPSAKLLTGRNPRLFERPLVPIIAIFSLHAFGLIRLFDVLPGLYNPDPIIEQDWGLHFHHLKSLAAFWQQDKSFWGYNPLFMAGYPSNTIQDLSIKLFEFLALALSLIALTPIQWFKITAFVAMAAIPWLMYFSARNLFARKQIRDTAALTSALLGTIYWWNSLPREMFFFGMIGYAAAAYASILGVSLFYRLAEQQTSWGAVHLGWVLFAIVILPLHVQSVIIFLPCILALLIMRPQLIHRQLVLWTVGAATISLALNLFWILPALIHRGDDVSQAIVEQLPLFVSTDPLTLAKDYFAPKNYWSFRQSFWEKGVRLMLLILGTTGTVKLLRDADKNVGILLVSALISLFLITYFSFFIPVLQAWQPMRFKIPFDLFLALGAAYALAHWRMADSAASRFHSYTVPLVLFAASVTFLINLVDTESRGKLRLRTIIGPEITEIARWVKQNTPDQARVLFEESGDETGFVYDGMYLSSFIPHWSGRQLIGGPINLYNDRHHFAEFHSGRLFGRDIRAFTDDEIKKYFRLYNIGAVVAYHPASLKRLHSIPGLITLDQRIGPVQLMRVNQPPDWFVQGQGQVIANLNRLEVKTSGADEVVLKYHWLEGLVSNPAATIVPVKIYDDPIPFIKVIEPPGSFTLRVVR